METPKLTVGKCLHCERWPVRGTCGRMNPHHTCEFYPRSNRCLGCPDLVPCPQCSGTGQVIGVPKGMIVVADGDTGRGLTFPKMDNQVALERILDYQYGERAIASDPDAVANLIMQEAGDE